MGNKHKWRYTPQATRARLAQAGAARQARQARLFCGVNADIKRVALIDKRAADAEINARKTGRLTRGLNAAYAIGAARETYLIDFGRLLKKAALKYRGDYETRYINFVNNECAEMPLNELIECITRLKYVMRENTHARF
jgi:hypothetical protein